MMPEEKFAAALRRLREAAVPARADVPLSGESSFRIGGPAALALWPENEAQLRAAVRVLREESVGFFVAGKASNLLFDDAGFAGAVLFTAGMRGVRAMGRKITAACGATLSSLAAAARDAGLTGAEFAYGIPGTVGGGVFMNAGAYGGQMADILRSCRLLDTNTGTVTERSAAEMDLSYRHSALSGMPGTVLLSAEFELTPGDPETVSGTMNELMRRRREKQPLEYPSAGSVFQRPAPDVYMGKLIEEAGLKGTAVGGARVSEKHAGFIVNASGATSADVKALVRLIQDRILERNGFVPVCEIRFVPSVPGNS